MVLRAQSRVLGGKGGFGSQLKAIGAQIQKTTSREACRDLSGRRVRDVNAEKRFNQLAREEKRRSEERRLQRERRREKRWAERTGPPILQDPLYYQSLEDNQERVSAALKHAMRRKQTAVEPVASAEKPVFREMGEQLSGGESERDRVPASGCVMQRDLDTDKVAGMDTVSCISGETHEDNSHPITTLLSPPLPTSDAAVPLLSDPITEPEPAVSTPDPIDLDAVVCREELEKFSLEVLKITLMSFGLKCGGTLRERVDRLYMYKVTPRDQLMPSIFATKGKSAGRKSDKR